MDTGGVPARERDAYYGEVYGDYAAQNPAHKLAFYRACSRTRTRLTRAAY
ncbi:MAG: hypothetical protein R3F62_05430 [Planctomycetota bacterium]